jgi:hypothetical protein
MEESIQNYKIDRLCKITHILMKFFLRYLLKQEQNCCPIYTSIEFYCSYDIVCIKSVLFSLFVNIFHSLNIDGCSSFLFLSYTAIIAIRILFFLFLLKKCYRLLFVACYRRADIHKYSQVVLY